MTEYIRLLSKFDDLGEEYLELRGYFIQMAIALETIRGGYLHATSKLMAGDDLTYHRWAASKVQRIAKAAVPKGAPHS